MKLSIILLLVAAPLAAAGEPPEVKVAALCTAYRAGWHADSIITKFLAGFTTDDGTLPPRVKVVSLYMDQPTPDDLGPKLAEHYRVPVYPTISGALTLGGEKLAVDAVLFVGEHGEYPQNRFGATMYPRMRIMEEVFRVFDMSGRSVPVYVDKHLSYNWLDSKWIYDRARELGVPLMAGSSVPLVWRNPPLEHPRGCTITEAVALTYASPDSYGVHAVEMIECMIERRAGGECGVASVQCLRGDAVYQAAREGKFSMELVDAAAATIAEKKPGTMQDHARDPVAILLTCADGLKATVIMTHEYYGMWWAYAARVDGKIAATQFVFPRLATKPAFSFLGRNIQEMFITGKPQWPIERTLLSSGVVDAALRSAADGGKLIETPHLRISYQPYDFEPIRGKGTGPAGAWLGPWPPDEIRGLYPKQ
ncbi:MAG TPA: hypothetical protein VM223_23515 [Planctomycetota bacterium]|nr:hypothetical protein [Planctomycetota bacterium]